MQRTTKPSFIPDGEEHLYPQPWNGKGQRPSFIPEGEEARPEGDADPPRLTATEAEAITEAISGRKKGR